MIQLQQSREEVYSKTQVIQESIKKIYDKRTKEDDFELGDLVLKQDSRNEDKGKHGKFDILWKDPYIIQTFRGNNIFFLKDSDGTDLPSGPVNGRMLKHYFPPQQKYQQSISTVHTILFIFQLCVGATGQMFEACREGPKALVSTTNFSK